MGRAALWGKVSFNHRQGERAGGEGEDSTSSSSIRKGVMTQGVQSHTNRAWTLTQVTILRHFFI